MIAQVQAATPVDEIQMRLFAVIGGEDPQEVIPLVDTQLAVAERELREVPLRAQEKGADFVQSSAPSMQTLLDQFNHYHSWLSKLKQALEEQNHQGYVDAYEEAQALIPALFAALESYSKLFAAYGPFASPWVNTLARIAQAIGAGQAPEDNWDESLVGFQNAFTQKLKEVRSAGIPGRTACAQAYQQALETVIKLQAAESLDEADLKPLFLELEENSLMGEKIERLMSEGLEGPAAMPVTNVVIAASRKALAQEIDPTLVSSFLDDYCELLDHFWEGFERSVTRPSDSALVQQEIPKTLEYGDEHDSAVEALTAALKSNDATAAEAALQQLIATSAKINESREVFETAAQHKTHAVCPGCGRANPPENRRCEACGNVLPTEAGSGASSTFNLLTGPALEETQEMPMTENVARLFNACDDVHEGKITVEQFQAVLTDSLMGLKEFARELSDVADEMADESKMAEETKMVWREQHLPYMQELSAHFVSGIKDCEAGLASMTAYVNDPDKEHLVTGVRTVWEGLGVIHRARLSMNSNLQMFQDLLEEMREQGLLVEPTSSEES